MKLNNKKSLIVSWILLFLTLSACTEDSPVNPSYPEGELILDSVSVYVVRGAHPYYGTPAGHFFMDVYFHLRGATGSMFRVELAPSPPGTASIGIEHPGYALGDPLPVDTPFERHYEFWLGYDFTDCDSIGTYFSATVKFWGEYESQVRDEPLYIPLGEDKKWLVMMVDVRDE